jgi:hypothetical protein
VQGSGGPLAPAAAVGGGKANQWCKQVSKRGRQQVLVEAADRGDEDEAGCSSDDIGCLIRCHLLMLAHSRLSRWCTR